MSEESKYLRKRKRKANLVSIRFLLMRIFPINEKKIVFSTFEGDGGFCCNPRYIAEELYKRNPDYKLVWLTHDTSRKFPEYIQVVKDSPWNVAYHLSTAKIWVDNYRKPYGTLKRKKQFYIQTWHASIGFKAVGLYRGDAFPEIAKRVSEWDSSLIDIMVSNSEYCDKVYPKKLLYNGPTLRVGSPRVDCLINDRELLYKKLRRELAIDDSTKLLLFAPTFRGGNQKGKKQVIAPIPTINFNKVIKALEEKTKSRWLVLLRLHPQLSAQMDKMPIESEDSKLIDVSQWDDISEIMGGCDLIITDYSSCAFDALFAKIPVLLYADDVQDYINNRGKFMWEKDELPFLMAETNEELIKNIRVFDIVNYEKVATKFILANKVYEEGRASEKVVDMINSVENKEKH